MSYRLKTPAAAEKAVGAYKKIENAVTCAYQKIETGVVGTYKKVEYKFVDAFLEDPDDPTEK